MSAKLMPVLVALGVLSSVAIALTVTPSDFGTPVVRWAFPRKADFDWIFAAVTKPDAAVTKPDFDWVFAEVETVSTLDHEHTVADSETIRLAALKQMNLGLQPK
jgi:hypothetical protein